MTLDDLERLLYYTCVLGARREFERDKHTDILLAEKCRLAIRRWCG